MGLRQAPSVPALAQSLRTENQLLVRTYRLPAWAARENRMRLKDHVALNEQLSQLLSRGVPLVEALEVTAQTVRPLVRPIIVRMKELVAAGSSFADACRSVGTFDSVTIAVYRGAERSGDLAGAARELMIAARRQLLVSGKAITLMIYPMVVLAIALAVSLGMMLTIVPSLAESLAKQDVELPWFSKIVMGTATAMRDNAVIVAAVLGSALIGAIVGRKALIALVARLMRRVPVIREVVMAQEAARFFSVMGAMVRTGVPIGDALTVANQVVTHPRLRTQLERLRTRLIEGGMLRTLIEEVTALPLATRRLLVAAERAGDMESAFVTLAADMTNEVETRSERVLKLLEPLLIVVLFIIIGTLLMAIMLPMLTMTQNIRF